LLLDTRIALWAITDDARLPTNVSRQPSNYEAAGVVVMSYRIWGDGRSGGAVIGGALLLEVVIETDTSDHLR
jgi:hypothetical protein